MERDGIEIVQLLAPAANRRDEVGGFELGEVLGHGLAGHVQVIAKLGERLPVAVVERVE